jgi:hypothetical protein
MDGLFCFVCVCLWLCVVSRQADIEISDEVRASLPQGHISVSVVSGQNISELKEQIDVKIVELLEAVKQMQQEEE